MYLISLYFSPDEINASYIDSEWNRKTIRHLNYISFQNYNFFQEIPCGIGCPINTQPQDALINQKEFIKLLFESIIAENSFLQYDKNTGIRNFLIYSGYHSNWSSKQIQEYCKFVKEVIPVDMFMSYEDSFFSWIENEKSLKNSSILYINYSGTVSDYLFYDSKMTLVCELHKSIGLKNIEEILYEYFLHNDSQFQRAYHEAYELCKQNDIWSRGIKRYLRKNLVFFYTREHKSINLDLRNRRFNSEFSEFIFDDVSIPYEKLTYEIFSDYRQILGNDLYEIKARGINPDHIVINGLYDFESMPKKLLYDMFCEIFPKSELHFCTSILADCIIRKAEKIYNKAPNM